MEKVHMVKCMNFRFPYLCFKNGGGAFLIPYFILIITGAVPMYFLEVIMGQYTRSGAIKIWDICPIFRWVWLIKFTPYLLVLSPSWNFPARAKLWRFRAKPTQAEQSQAETLQYSSWIIFVIYSFFSSKLFFHGKNDWYFKKKKYH